MRSPVKYGIVQDVGADLVVNANFSVLDEVKRGGVDQLREKAAADGYDLNELTIKQSVEPYRLVEVMLRVNDTELLEPSLVKFFSFEGGEAVDGYEIRTSAWANDMGGSDVRV